MSVTHADCQISVQIKIPATLRAVRTLCSVVLAVASDICDDLKFVEQVELGVAEAANNIVKHGYKQDKSCYISIEICSSPESIRISFRDQAPWFDPLADLPSEDTPFDFSKAIEDSLHLGRIMMREAMDGLEYKQLDDGNMLIMRKAIPDNERQKGAPE